MSVTRCAVRLVSRRSLAPLPPFPDDGNLFTFECAFFSCARSGSPSISIIAISNCSSFSAHKIRFIVITAPRMALKTAGAECLCTALATLSPLANGSSTPILYFRSGQEHPHVHLPAYVDATNPFSHIGSTAFNVTKKSTKSSAKVFWLSAPNISYLSAFGFITCGFLCASALFLSCETSLGFSNSFVSSHSFWTRCISFSTDSSSGNVTLAIGGQIPCLCMVNNANKHNEYELNVPFRASFTFQFLAHILMQKTRSRYRRLWSATKPITADLYTPSLCTHTSHATPVSGSRNFTNGTLACAINCTSSYFLHLNSLANFANNCTLFVLCAFLWSLFGLGAPLCASLYFLSSSSLYHCEDG